MKDDSKERVAVYGPDGVRLFWTRDAAGIFQARAEGPLTVRGTRRALELAGVGIDQGCVPFGGQEVAVTVEVLTAPLPGSIPRPPSPSKARRTVPVLLRLTPEADARLRAVAEAAGESLSATVTRLLG